MIDRQVGSGPASAIPPRSGEPRRTAPAPPTVGAQRSPSPPGRRRDQAGGSGRGIRPRDQAAPRTHGRRRCPVADRRSSETLLRQRRAAGRGR